MPAKKQGKNAFFFYMLEVQAEMQRKSGRKIPMKDMPAVAGPKWSVSAICCSAGRFGTSRVSGDVRNVDEMFAELRSPSSDSVGDGRDTRKLSGNFRTVCLLFTTRKRQTVSIMYS